MRVRRDPTSVNRCQSSTMSRPRRITELTGQWPVEIICITKQCTSPETTLSALAASNPISANLWKFLEPAQAWSHRARIMSAIEPHCHVSDGIYAESWTPGRRFLASLRQRHGGRSRSARHIHTSPYQRLYLNVNQGTRGRTHCTQSSGTILARCAEWLCRLRHWLLPRASAVAISWR